jgi:fused signal recognition particle receptor
MDPWVWYVVGGGVVLLVVVALIARRRAGEEVSQASIDESELSDRLSKTRDSFGSRLKVVFAKTEVDKQFWADLEDELIAADLGVAASTAIIEAVGKAKPSTGAEVRAALETELGALMAGRDRSLMVTGDPSIMVVVGVNGVGKTTTIAKLAKRLERQGRTPILGAADTFRAAADTQLKTWADRVGVDVISGQQGADPAAIAYDTLQAGKARGADGVIIDTAGRLQNKSNLMAELGKIVRVLTKDGDEVSEILLVIDATTGQNGLSQARQFTETVGVTGIVLTKLDGTAKGGVVIAIEQEMGIPVKFIGLGEGIDDLIPFDGQEFVQALLART